MQNVIPRQANSRACTARSFMASLFLAISASFAAPTLLAGPSASATGGSTPVGTDTVRIVMNTDLGAITFELYPHKAPLTVENFLRYVDGGLLDGGSFYRSVRLDNQKENEIPIEVVQGGLFGDAIAQPGSIPPETLAPIPHEPTSETGLRHVPGAISMARAEPGTATSEFFVSLADSPELDAGGQRNPDGHGFAVFGRVVEGMDVLERIHLAPTARSSDREELGPMQGQVLDTLIHICSATRVEVGEIAGADGPDAECGAVR